MLENNVLSVPGAQLYYEQRGAGPLLLLISAGAGDADSYRAIAGRLAEHTTVITYDRRGYARSPLDDPEQTITIATHAADAAQLLAALDRGPANVLGCSIGAVIGLELARRHPEQVRRLVAHEPPLPALLAEGERAANRREQQAVLATLRTQGPAAAQNKLAENLGFKRAAGLMDADTQAPRSPFAEQNGMAFFKYDAPAVARYAPDLDGLRAVADKIVVAGGREGRMYAPYQAAAALAALLGQALVEFPGHHSGFVEYPQTFAERLMEALQ
jgi:pimeloyl-ACP methyl ester carboxylesterase